MARDDSFSDLDDSGDGAPANSVDKYGSFRDARAVIEEEELKRQQSFMFDIPENMSLQQRKEHSWEPSVLNESIMSDANMSQEALAPNAEHSRRIRTAEPSTREQPERAADVSQSFSTSILDSKNVTVPWQSTPISAKGKSRLRKMSKIIPDLSETQFSTIPMDNGQSFAKLKPSPSIVSMSGSVVAPTNSMIADLLDTNTKNENPDASRFLGEIKNRRAERRLNKDRSISAVTEKLSEIALRPRPLPQPAYRFGSTASIATTGSSRPSSSTNFTSNRPELGDAPFRSIRTLTFGFVALGDKVLQDYEIENMTDRTLTIDAVLASSVARSAFSINTNQLQIPARQKKNLSVTFAPTTRARYKCQLALSTVNVVYNRKILLFGYGGTAVVGPILENELNTTKEGYFVLNTSNHAVVSVRLINSGTRSAFVRLTTAPMENASERACPKIIIEPSEKFILGKSATKQLKVRTECTDSPIGNFRLIVYWGEETQRQRLKAYEIRKNKEYLYDGITFTATKFDEEFDESGDCQDASRFDKLDFFNNIRKVDIHVYNNRLSNSRHSLHDDSDMTLTTTMCDATLTPGRSVVYDVTRAFNVSQRPVSKK